MTNEIKRKHHFVPAFYLRGFTEPSSDNMIWAYNKGSDNPFFFHDPSPGSSSFWRGVGLLNENVEVTFPISKELALIATWKDSMTEKYLQGSHELVRTINRCSVAGAHRAVYASEKSDALVRLVKKFANNRPTMFVG